MNNIKIIGLGGIGTYLAEPLCRFLHHQADRPTVTLIDGDTYERRNEERQQFTTLGNKATHTTQRLQEQFPKIHFKTKPEYITEDNVIPNIRENDVVFLCVDNHNTRKTVSDRCGELDNVTLISGGNDYTDGNVIFYHRKDGEDVTKSPTQLYPSIANPTDENPQNSKARSGCQIQTASAPQLLFTNLALASCMLNVYYGFQQGRTDVNEVFVDINAHRMRATPERQINFDD